MVDEETEEWLEEKLTEWKMGELRQTEWYEDFNETTKDSFERSSFVKSTIGTLSKLAELLIDSYGLTKEQAKNTAIKVYEAGDLPAVEEIHRQLMMEQMKPELREAVAIARKFLREHGDDVE